MRKINRLGIELIKKHEGFVSNIYLDCAGYLTIGFGHLCREGDFYLNGLSLEEARRLCEKNKSKAKLVMVSKVEAENILKSDLKIAEEGVCRLIKVPLNSNQFSALVSFVFNLGTGALQRSTLRQKLNRSEYLAVPKEMMRWVYANGIKRRGLVKRRFEEGVLFNHL